VAALLGANGAGKSTLLRVAAGLLSPQGGVARLFGRDVGALARRDVARLVAFVPQTEETAAGFLVREVVGMGRAPHQDGWMRPRAEDRAVVEDALARCNLAAFAARPVETLSGGEQRRVAIARALAQRPRVLLADEPVASLDPEAAEEIMRLLRRLAAHENLAVLCVLHQVELAYAYADRVVGIRDGAMVFDLPRADVSRETVRRLYLSEAA
jgi:iron complex transport system ATP-binding protein